MGTIIGTIASLLIGGVVATATVIGVVSSQTGDSAGSPADVTQPVVQYGSSN